MNSNFIFQRAAFFFGLVLLLTAGIMLGGVYLSVDPSRLAEERAETGFHRLLRDYDFRSRRILADGDHPARHELENLNFDLGRLERAAQNVEIQRLSVLKRRRDLALLDSRFNQAYQQSVRRAAADFPHSEAVAIIAAAALIRGTGITRGVEEELRNILSPPAGHLFVPARLAFHAVLGDFRTPERAAEYLPFELMETVFSQAVWGGNLPGIPAAEIEAVITNLAIARVLAGDTASATAAVQSRLAAPSPEFIRFAAEYHYDFGDLLHSAQLFSLLPDEAALIRQADALWLAGHSELARNIWTILAGAAQSPATPAATRSLYNLALTAPEREEGRAFLQRLAGLESGGTPIGEDPSRLFGLIRYSRFLEAQQAIAVLERGRGDLAVANTVADTVADVVALTDLEILRRQAETRETARTIAETWMLLDRHPETEELYHWAAWFFNLQRSPAESAILLRNAGRRDFQSQWTIMYTALQQLHEGDVEGAEDTLTSIPMENAHWAVAANLGRIFEVARAPARALTSYQQAIEILMADSRPAATWDDRDERLRREIASRIQVRIARSFITLGRSPEGRQALQIAIELDPENLNARFELGRLN